MAAEPPVRSSFARWWLHVRLASPARASNLAAADALAPGADRSAIQPPMTTAPTAKWRVRARRGLSLEEARRAAVGAGPQRDPASKCAAHDHRKCEDMCATCSRCGVLSTLFHPADSSMTSAGIKLRPPSRKQSQPRARPHPGPSVGWRRQRNSSAPAHEISRRRRRASRARWFPRVTVVSGPVLSGRFF